MQARVNQSCSQSWDETGIAFGEHPGARRGGRGVRSRSGGSTNLTPRAFQVGARGRGGRAGAPRRRRVLRLCDAWSGACGRSPVEWRASQSPARRCGPPS